MSDDNDNLDLSLDFISAKLVVAGTAAISQSHQHGEKWLEGESANDYDLRTWRSKLNTDIIDGQEGG